MNSKHWKTDRQKRNQIIAQIGIGQVIKEVTIDRGHKNGPEIHKITSTGLIVIYNKRTNIMITILIARPNQIKRYYAENEAPQKIINLAFEHMRAGYNKI
jgi:hypothetical protein